MPLHSWYQTLNISALIPVIRISSSGYPIYVNFHISIFLDLLFIGSDEKTPSYQAYHTPWTNHVFLANFFCRRKLITRKDAIMLIYHTSGSSSLLPTSPQTLTPQVQSPLRLRQSAAPIEGYPAYRLFSFQTGFCYHPNL